MSGKRYADQPLDDSSRRSIRILDRETVSEDSEFVFVDNFYHESEFWTAKIPLDSIDQIYGQSFNFSKPKTRQGANGPEIVYKIDGSPKRKIKGLNHLQSRFKLKPGATIDLYPMGSDLTAEPVHRLDDFVYSLEAVGPIGVNFNLKDGLRGNLVSAHRFLSTQEMVFERVVVENQYVVEAAEIPLTSKQKKIILLKSLMRSDDAGMSEPYFLCGCKTNNCTSNPFRILDSVVHYGFWGRVGSLLFRLPINPRLYLRLRGLDSEPGRRRFMRHEFETFINDKATQKRKRAYVKSKIQATRKARKKNQV